MLLEERVPPAELRWRKAAGQPFPRVLRPFAIRKCRAHNAPLAKCWLIWVWNDQTQSYLFVESHKDHADAVHAAARYARERRAA